MHPTDNSDSPLPEIAEARKVLLDFYSAGFATCRSTAIQVNVQRDRRNHRRFLLAAFDRLVAEGLVTSSAKRLLTGVASTKFLYHFGPDLLDADALSRLKLFVVLSPAVRPTLPNQKPAAAAPDLVPPRAVGAV